MRLVTVEQTEPGMVLAAAATDRRGRLLIPAEVTLTERHINALRMWGVPHVEVMGGAPERRALSVSPEEAQRVSEEIDARFGDSDPEHEFITALRECATGRALGALDSQVRTS